MSRKYKFYNKQGIYFVSFATIGWVDVFVRECYSAVVTEALNFYIREAGMEVYCWCLMPSHMHLIFSDNNGHPDKLLGRFKSYTSRELQQMIVENMEESRREWLIAMFAEAGAKSSKVTTGQFWQHHNKSIELWSQPVAEQKINYIHQNPVLAGFITEAAHWKYSSAADYNGSKGLVETTLLC